MNRASGPPDDVLILLDDADQRLVRAVDALGDDDWERPSLLPGWRRSHVVAHLALNAEGLARSARGVTEGRPEPMYDSQEARDRDIDELATAEPTELRERLMAGVTLLKAALTDVRGEDWSTRVERTPGGPTFSLRAVPRMRLREVEIHLVDLDAGPDRSTWSPELSGIVVTDGLKRVDLPVRELRATDTGMSWPVKETGPVVSGRSADLAWWLTGRGSGEGLDSEGGQLPPVGAW